MDARLDLPDFGLALLDERFLEGKVCWGEGLLRDLLLFLEQLLL